MVSKQGTYRIPPYSHVQVNNFHLSISQYETQLHAWGFRKHLSRDEWALAFETVDKLKSLHKETRILISGAPVEIAQLVRARRIYNKEKHRNPNRTMQGDSFIAIVYSGL